MNLQQLNGSGQTLWKFVVTALVALIITGGTWYIAEAANVYRNWHRKRAEQDRLGAEDKGLTYSVVERIAMIMWLLRKHHLAWMWRTGAWSKILFNSTKPMGDDYSGRRYSAGELVSKYSLGQLEDYELKRFIPQKTTRNDPRASKASA